MSWWKAGDAALRVWCRTLQKPWGVSWRTFTELPDFSVSLLVVSVISGQPCARDLLGGACVHGNTGWCCALFLLLLRHSMLGRFEGIFRSCIRTTAEHGPPPSVFFLAGETAVSVIAVVELLCQHGCWVFSSHCDEMCNSYSHCWAVLLVDCRRTLSFKASSNALVSVSVFTSCVPDGC